jgi:hypothetical protein
VPDAESGDPAGLPAGVLVPGDPAAGSGQAGA